MRHSTDGRGPPSAEEGGCEVTAIKARRLRGFISGLPENLLDRLLSSDNPILNAFCRVLPSAPCGDCGAEHVLRLQQPHQTGGVRNVAHAPHPPPKDGAGKKSVHKRPAATNRARGGYL